MFLCPECGTEMIRNPIDPDVLMHVESTDCAPDPWPTPENTPEGCHWLIRVPSNHPEPDFPEDLWREVECGAELTINEYGSWRCAAGHEYVTYDDPARGLYDAEQAFLERREEGY
jgi:hypothetical protein